MPKKITVAVAVVVALITASCVFPEEWPARPPTPTLIAPGFGRIHRLTLMVPTPTPAPPTATATPTRDPTNTPTATPSPQENAQPRWKQYESALVEAILPKGYRGICEWEILGQQKNEVYVWALCASSPAGAKGSVPAVIVFDQNGEIKEVKVPGDGWAYAQDIRKWFPPEVREKVFNFHSQLTTDEAFKKRFLDHTLPPQIVVSGTPLP